MSGILNALIGSYAPAGGSFESIATATGTGSSGTITFSSIPSTYQHLQIRGIFKYTSTGTIREDLALTFNADTGTNYSFHTLIGAGSFVSAGAGANTSYIECSNIVGSSISSSILTAVVIDIHDYASTTKNKTVRSIVGSEANISSSDYRITFCSGLWRNTNAINSLTLQVQGGTNFTTNTTVALYGIKA